MPCYLLALNRFLAKVRWEGGKDGENNSRRRGLADWPKRKKKEKKNSSTSKKALKCRRRIGEEVESHYGEDAADKASRERGAA